MKTVREEDLRLAEMLQTMRHLLEQPQPSLTILKSSLDEALQLLEARQQNLLSSRGFALEEDPLTGLLSQTAFNRTLEQVFSTGESFSLVYLEPDHLEALKLRLSPSAYQESLGRLGLLVRKALRASDVAGRIGDQGFGLLLRGITGDRTFGVCERLRVAVLKYPWTQLHPELQMTISLGYTGREDAESAQQIVNRARRFQAEARSSGQNQTFPGLYY